MLASPEEDEASCFHTESSDKGVHALNEIAPFPHAPVRWRLQAWHIIVLFGILEMALTGFGTFFDIYGRIGSFYVYLVSYFNALIVILPILLIRRFGVGTAVYLPYALVGFFLEYSLEQHILVSIWGTVGWCVFGLATGFSADLANRFLSGSPRWRAILIGIIMGSVNFLLALVAVSFFYTVHPPAPYTFAGVAFFALPWLILNSALGGYTAYALSRSA
jgi:hypothetical protein